MKLAVLLTVLFGVFLLFLVPAVHAIPSLIINSPQNTTYMTSSIPLSFTSNETVNVTLVIDGIKMEFKEINISNNETTFSNPDLLNVGSYFNHIYAAHGTHWIDINVKNSDGDSSRLIYFTKNTNEHDINVTSCGIIVSSDTYKMVNDIKNSSQFTCIQILSNNTNLNCQGHTINGAGTLSNLYGIEEGGFLPYWISFNNTIENCAVNGWLDALQLIAPNNNAIRNNTLDNTTRGIIYWQGNYLGNSGNNTIKDNIIDNNQRGIQFGYVGQAVIGFPNIIFNNIMFNDENIVFSNPIQPNTWNVPIQPGNNIWNASSSVVGGNIWSIFSETCDDLNSDGFCDSPLTIAANNTDYNPIAVSAGQGTPNVPFPLLSCQPINEPGNYTMYNDFINKSVPLSNTLLACLQIMSPNVTFDCRSHKLNGIDKNTYSLGFGVFNSSVVIKNCNISDWYNGVFVYQDNSTIENVTTDGNGLGVDVYQNSGSTIENNTLMDGLSLEADYSFPGSHIVKNNILGPERGLAIRLVEGNVIKNNTIRNVSTAIDMASGIYNNISYNTVENSSTGVLLRGLSLGNLIESNVLVNNNVSIDTQFPSQFGPTDTIKNNIFAGNFGIIVTSGFANNFIYNNLFDNINSTVFESDEPNFWNTTKEAGTRIASSGPDIGGNLWINPAANGFSNVCKDAKRSGFCDTPLSLSSSSTDFLPLSYRFLPDVVCGSVISSPGGYAVKGNIITFNGTCILIKSNNVFLDLTGSTVDGNTTFDSIDIENTSNVTVTNGLITNSNRGVFSHGSKQTNITQLNLTNNNLGILFNSTNDSVVTNVNSSFNINDGILIQFSNNTIVRNNVANGNSNGIRLASSNFNDISINAANFNQNDGVKLFSSNNSFIGGNECKFNFVGIHITSSSDFVLGHGTQINRCANNPGGKIIIDPSRNFSVEGNEISGTNESDGIIIIESSNGILVKNVILNNINGLNFISAKNIVSFNDFISNSSNYDVIINDSNIVFINTTFNESKVQVLGSFAFNVSWFLDIGVMNETEFPIENATISIFDKDSNLITTLLTDSLGKIPTQTLLEFLQNSTGQFFKSPYTIVVSKEGFVTNTSTIILNQSLNTTIVLREIHKVLTAIVNIDPNTLNLDSVGRWISAFVEIPNYNLSRINISTVMIIFESNAVQAVDDTQFGFVAYPSIVDRNGNGYPELMVKFDRRAVQNIFLNNNITGYVTLNITGNLGNLTFFGEDIIRVIKKVDDITQKVESPKDMAVKEVKIREPKPQPQVEDKQAEHGKKLVPPGQEKKPDSPPGQNQTPPGQNNTPPGQEKKGGGITGSFVYTIYNALVSILRSIINFPFEVRI